MFRAAIGKDEGFRSNRSKESAFAQRGKGHAMGGRRLRSDFLRVAFSSEVESHVAAMCSPEATGTRSGLASAVHEAKEFGKLQRGPGSWWYHIHAFDAK